MNKVLVFLIMVIFSVGLNKIAISQNKDFSPSQPEKKISGLGTGFIITKDGYILTCYHVVKDAMEIEISFEKQRHSAMLILDDPNNDLALLKINGSFPAIAFSSKRSGKVGEEVFTVGYPNPNLQGVNAKFTKGTINSLTGFKDDIRLYQVDMPVQPGNSGGALFDENGNILGVIIATLNAEKTFNITGTFPQNVNYAVKHTYALAMLDTLPGVSGKLISPAGNKSNAVDNAIKSSVIVINISSVDDKIVKKEPAREQGTHKKEPAQQFTNRYVDNKNGTVTDSKTGLMWQQGETNQMNFDSAISYCQDLNLAGYSDWRLPSKEELESIIDKYRMLSIDINAFPGAKNSGYWSSTPYTYYPSYAYYVNFHYGHANFSDKSNKNFYVRAVRGGL